MRIFFDKKQRFPRSALILLLSTLLLITGCTLEKKEPLPVLATLEIPYTFTNQDGILVNQALFKDKIFVADFFFTSCPTICPIMKTQMLRVYEAFESEDRLQLLSHTIDPEHDTVAVLHDYAERLQIRSNRWHLVTGKKEEIYATALLYGLAAKEDENAPGGFIHSGSFCLVDGNGQLRGYYRGTEKESVNRLIKDIRRLFNETK